MGTDFDFIHANALNFLSCQTVSQKNTSQLTGSFFPKNGPQFEAALTLQVETFEVQMNSHCH